jgi:hypothetical protein
VERQSKALPHVASTITRPSEPRRVNVTTPSSGPAGRIVTYAPGALPQAARVDLRWPDGFALKTPNTHVCLHPGQSLKGANSRVVSFGCGLEKAGPVPRPLARPTTRTCSQQPMWSTRLRATRPVPAAVPPRLGPRPRCEVLNPLGTAGIRGDAGCTARSRTRRFAGTFGGNGAAPGSLKIVVSPVRVWVSPVLKSPAYGLVLRRLW